MQLYHPISHEECQPLLGMPVCAIMQDGTRHYGILSRAENGKVYLNEEAANGTSPITASPVKSKGKTQAKTKLKAKVKAKGKASHAQTQALSPAKGTKPTVSNFGVPEEEGFERGFVPFSPFRNRVVLDLATIAFLFLLFL
ncbi:hypothetical protein [Paenibacillus koleovorans]|uniref:hypothetical protein n=1 Tax=Paenibacillus koleovorans TaxID=121608 RepID=UPI000FD86F28|nr:hypothetical protein [Paenibacillus koleovorans]